MEQEQQCVTAISVARCCEQRFCIVGLDRSTRHGGKIQLKVFAHVSGHRPPSALLDMMATPFAGSEDLEEVSLIDNDSATSTPRSAVSHSSTGDDSFQDIELDAPPVSGILHFHGSKPVNKRYVFARFFLLRLPQLRLA